MKPKIPGIAKMAKIPLFCQIAEIKDFSPNTKLTITNKINTPPKKKKIVLTSETHA